MQMQAIIQTSRTADGLQPQSIEKPSPQAHELLVKVHAATVTAGDVVMRKMPRIAFVPLSLFGLKYKRTPGHEFSGVVEAVGADVTRFAVGDAVFGTTTGLSTGANAEYLVIPEAWKSGVVTHKPATLTDVQAAALPVGGMTALEILRRGDIQPGQRVLIYGASGSVGSYAVQIARYLGAEVTGVCSTANIEMVKRLGAQTVIDYKTTDITASDQTYDVIFDAVGKTSRSVLKAILAEGGVYLSTKTMTTESLDNLDHLKTLAEGGHITPFVDRCFPLDQVAAAHQLVESGRKRGNVVIQVVG